MTGRTPYPLLLVVLSLLTACAPDRAWQAKGLMDEIGGGTISAAVAVTRTEHGFAAETRAYRAVSYRSTKGADPISALILVPGADPLGADHPALVSFATALARVGFWVLVPDLANLRALRVGPEDAVAILDAARHARVTLGVERVGVAAISYAVGPAVLAAREGDTIDWVLGIGGYYDMAELITTLTTGWVRDGPDGPLRHRPGDDYGKWVFAISNLPRLADGLDRWVLSEIATRRLRAPEAPIDDLAPMLGDEGRAVLALLENRDPGAVSDLIDALPAAIRDDMAALDLADKNLAGLGAHLLLVHGRGDPVIPDVHSRALARAVPRAELHLLDGLVHVDIDRTRLGAGDRMVLWRAAYRLLELRDGL